MAFQTNDQPDSEQLELAQLDALTRREIEILTEFALGGTAKHIARRLKVAQRTVYIHSEAARRKLQAGTITEAVAKAIWLGLIRKDRTSDNG